MKWNWEDLVSSFFFFNSIELIECIFIYTTHKKGSILIEKLVFIPLQINQYNTINRLMGFKEGEREMVYHWSLLHLSSHLSH